MTVLARIRGHELELIRDNYVLQNLVPELKWAIAIPARWTSHPTEGMTAPAFRYIILKPAYYEYDVDDTGVTRYVVYLPEGAKPPREGVGY